MVKARRLTRLITLCLLIATASIAGHFAVEAVWVVLDAVDSYDCPTGVMTSSSSDSGLTGIVGLHGSFNLPSAFPDLSLITLTFILAAITLAKLSYTPSLSPPPPKTLS